MSNSLVVRLSAPTNIEPSSANLPTAQVWANEENIVVVKRKKSTQKPILLSDRKKDATNRAASIHRTKIAIHHFFFSCSKISFNRRLFSLCQLRISLIFVDFRIIIISEIMNKRPVILTIKITMPFNVVCSIPGVLRLKIIIPEGYKIIRLKTIYVYPY